MQLKIIIITLLFHICVASQITFVAKSNLAFKTTQNSSPVVETGIAALDEMNKHYCCQKFDRLYTSIKDTVFAYKLGMDRVYVFSLACNAEDTSKVISDYRGLGLFEYVEINQHLKSISTTPFYPNDIAFKWQWGLNNTGKNVSTGAKDDADIDIPEAWGLEQGDTSLIIAILDSGIKKWHGEFDGRLWKNKDEQPGDKKDDDSNGYVDDVNGWNFAYGDTLIDDDRGHGTAVATVIGANVNNDSAFSGINGKSKLMILKITDITGRAYASSIASAIQYATDKGARVINFSHASPSKLVLVNEAIEYAYKNNVLICAGTGNDNADSIYYPAKYPHVLAVGATDPLDKRCNKWLKEDSTVGGSNFGDSLDVVAPGEKIAVLGYKYGDFLQKDGTSYATAFVTGLASLLISQNQDITPDMLTKIICSTAEDQIGDLSEDIKGYDKYYGYGRINAYNALLKGEELKTGKKPKALVNKDLSKRVSWSRYTQQLNVFLGYEVNNKSPITIRVVDASGRVLKTILQSELYQSHRISLPAISRGVYFYSIKHENSTWSGKIVN